MLLCIAAACSFLFAQDPPPYFFPALLLLITLASCEKEGALPAQAGTLLQTHWRLTQINSVPVAVSGYYETNRALALTRPATK